MTTMFTRRLGPLLMFAVSLSILSSSTPANAAVVCDQGVCVAGAAWSNGEQLDDKARAREAKRNRKGKDATLTVEIVGARGSVFLDGVWIAVAPISYVPIKPGKHDLEVRDGERVLARGVLEIDKKGGDVAVRIEATTS